MIEFDEVNAGLQLIFATRARGRIAGLHHKTTRTGTVVRRTSGALFVHCTDGTYARILAAEYTDRVLDDLTPLRAPLPADQADAQLARRVWALEQEPDDDGELTELLDAPALYLGQSNLPSAASAYLHAEQVLRQAYAEDSRNQAAPVVLRYLDTRVERGAGTVARNQLSVFLFGPHIMGE